MTTPDTPFFPVVETGLVSGGGQLLDVVAEAKFEVAEELGVGGVGEFAGEGVDGVFDEGPEPFPQGLETVGGFGRGSGHGGVRATEAKERS